eukprot:m.68927 g.68927  ORF g.68927 m.68927 type:complete len:268 (-) comp24018_c1_seq1:153-956(-)
MDKSRMTKIKIMMFAFVCEMGHEVAGDGRCTATADDGVYDCGSQKADLSQMFCGGEWSASQTCKAQEPSGDWDYYFTIHPGGIPSAWQSSDLDCDGGPWNNAMAIQYTSSRDNLNCYLTSDDQDPTFDYVGESGNISSIIVNFQATSEGRTTVLVANCSANTPTPSYSVSESAGTYYIYALGKCFNEVELHTSVETTGWVLIGVFFVGGLLYFIGGFVYNMKRKNLEGKEALPHKDFWFALPGLVKTGLRFSLAKVMCREAASYESV